MPQEPEPHVEAAKLKAEQDEADEVAKLKAQLVAMEEESERLRAIVELEEMKALLLDASAAGATGPPTVPRDAWSEPSAAVPLDDSETLSADDEARLAQLLGPDEDDEDAAAFAAKSPEDMATLLASMERELTELKLQRDTQAQMAELESLKSQLDCAQLAHRDAHAHAQSELKALHSSVTQEM